MIYLDYNATSPLHPQVQAAMQDVQGEPLNPSSIHAAGRAARKIKEEARAKILQSVNAQALVFCGSGTEANNLALNQAAKHIISNVEHDSVFKTANSPVFVKVDQDGLLDVEELEKSLKGTENALVSVILVNNETGVIQDLRTIAEIAHRHGALVHTDAVQAWGKFALDFTDLGVDMMTISAHKIGGPVGVAALVCRADLELKPILKGGGQEKNKRPGTENVALIHGFAACVDLPKQTSELRDYLEATLRKIAPSAQIHGFNSPRTANTSNISMPNMDSATQLIHFDSKDICVSSGSACSSGKIEESRVLREMGVENSKNALRVSTGWNSTKEEIDRFLRAWGELYARANAG